MSFRGGAQTIAEQIAELYEKLRSTEVNVSALAPVTTFMAAIGDLVVGRGPQDAARLPVGPDGTVLTGDSTAELGMSWQPPGAAVADPDIDTWRWAEVAP